MARKRRVKSVKTELVRKAREAMLAAVQLYNNPQVTFKAESFITEVLRSITDIITKPGKRKSMTGPSMARISTGNSKGA